MSSPNNQTELTQSKTWFKNGDFRFHILNDKNKPINEDFLNNIFKKYGLKHKVKYLKNFQTAMIHVSYLNRTAITDKTAKILKDIPPIENPESALPLEKHSYDRLEFLGDTEIHSALTRYLFKRYKTEGEGFLTTLRTKLEKGETLSKLSIILGLNKYAVIARNIELANGREDNYKLTEDIFEAFIGALSLEVSTKKCRKFIINIIEKHVDIAELNSLNDNYKEQLMQKYHKLKWSEPKYYDCSTLEQKETEPKTYTMCVKTQTGEIAGIGNGITKTKAEQLAAKNALYALGFLKDEDENSDYYGEISDEEEDIYEVEDIQENKNNSEDIEDIYEME
jgi:ribonuclease-3